MRVCIVCCMALFVTGAAATTASATFVTYDANIVVNWYNSYLGVWNCVDPNGKVTVEYIGGGNFRITDIEYNYTQPGIGSISLEPAGNTSGMIANGVASGGLGFQGTALTGQGTFNVYNGGGLFVGAVANGSTFSPGDVYALQAFSPGTLSPAIAGVYGNWDLLNDAPTRIEFLPEPAGLALLALGWIMFGRRWR